MKKHLQLLLLLALTLPFFTACKDDKEEVIAPSKTELLVAHEWKGDQVLMLGIDISETGGVQEVPDIRTVRLTFNRDNTYIAKVDGGMAFEGDWRFNQDETKIYFDFYGLEEFDLKELTTERLNISSSISKSQLTLLAQVLNIDLGIINSFPDGTEFETELKFVKP